MYSRTTWLHSFSCKQIASRSIEIQTNNFNVKLCLHFIISRDHWSLSFMNPHSCAQQDVVQFLLPVQTKCVIGIAFFSSFIASHQLSQVFFSSPDRSFAQSACFDRLSRCCSNSKCNCSPSPDNKTIHYHNKLLVIIVMIVVSHDITDLNCNIHVHQQHNDI